MEKRLACAFVRRRQDVSTPLEWLRYLASPPAIGERIRFFFPFFLSPPKENIRGRYLQKYRATLKLEDKWMV